MESHKVLDAPPGSPCYIDGLPDEILVSIFQYLKPKQLLYGMSLVCKRWYELAKDPQSWQNVSYTLWDDRRIWNHAPVIGHLEVLAPNETEIEKLRQLVELTGPATVRSMRIILRHPKDAVGILKKYEKFVRVLDLQVGGQDARPLEWQEFFDTIGKLTDLRSLSVRISPNSLNIPYHGQISVGCPLLRYLRVRGQEAISAALIRDLGKKVTTLVLSCSFGELSSTLIEALQTCEAVEDMTLPCSLVGAIGHMHSLKALKVIADHGPTFVDEAMGLAGPVLRHVESLEVLASRNQISPDFGMNKTISAMASHLKNCKYVDFRCLHTVDEFLSEFIHEARKVEHYKLCCRIYHLLQIEQIESVRTVRALLDSTYNRVPYVLDNMNRLRELTNKKFTIVFHFIDL